MLSDHAIAVPPNACDGISAPYSHQLARLDTGVAAMDSSLSIGQAETIGHNAAAPQPVVR